MAKPIAVQLYSVREALAQDFDGVIRQIAAMGYKGVETAGFPGTTAQAAADLFKSLGLEVPSAHIGLPLGDKRDEVLETMKLLGAKYLVCAYLPPDEFKSAESIRAAANRLNEANAVARDNGLTLLYHNHWWEYQPLGDTYPYKLMLENLDPTIGFEVDTYWVQTAGLNATDVLRELGARVPLVHLKDGPCVTDQPMVAVGSGSMDVPAVVEAAAAAEWFVVELDRCATDMMEAVGKSYQYLIEEGLVSGNQS